MKKFLSCFISILTTFILFLSCYQLSLLLDYFLGRFSPFISLLLCISIVFYYINSFHLQSVENESKIKKQLIKNFDIIYNFDYSSLLIIKKILCKNEHFFIVLDNMEFALPDSFLEKMTTSTKIKSLDINLYNMTKNKSLDYNYLSSCISIALKTI